MMDDRTVKRNCFYSQISFATERKNRAEEMWRPEPAVPLRRKKIYYAIDNALEAKRKVVYFKTYI